MKLIKITLDLFIGFDPSYFPTGNIQSDLEISNSCIKTVGGLILPQVESINHTIQNTFDQKVVAIDYSMEAEII